MKKRYVLGSSLVVVLIISAVFAVNASERKKVLSDVQETVEELDMCLIQEETDSSREKMADLLSRLKSCVVKMKIADVESVLESDQYSVESKIFMVESIGDKQNELSQENMGEISSLVFDKEIEREVRISLLQLIPEEKEYNEMMVKLIGNEEDDLIISQAIKKYYQIDPEAAASTAIKQVQETESEEIGCSCLYILPSAVADGYIESETVMDICNEILNQKTGKTAMAAGYALGDLNTIEAMAILLESNLDDIVKIGCVEQNYETFLTCLSGNPTETEIGVIIEAMKIYPITEILNILEEYSLSESNRLEVESLMGQTTFEGNSKKIDVSKENEYTEESGN